MSRAIDRRSFIAATAAAPLFMPSTLLGGLGRMGVNDQVGIGFIRRRRRREPRLLDRERRTGYEV